MVVDMNCKILLFDLDGTLLKSDKTLSEHTLNVLKECRKKGLLIGVSTSRSEKNSMKFIPELSPDAIISSGGALVKLHERYIYTAEFTVDETRKMIALARSVCGADCEITIDTISEHYWNYKIDPQTQDASWGKSAYSDFEDFSEKALKMCVEISNPDTAGRMIEQCTDCDCARFSDGDWYKFTKKTATKENAILKLCEECGITQDNIIAFGDDFPDIGMLKLCGKGIAMGNAIDEVKEVADQVIGTNDDEGIAKYLTETFLDSASKSN